MLVRVARAVTRRPWLVIAGWLVVGTGVMLASPGLGSITNSDQSSFLPAGAESARAAVLAQEAFPDAAGLSAVIVVTRSGGGTLGDADLARVGSLTGLERPPGVTEVAYDPTQMVAPNRQVAMLVVRFADAGPDGGAAVGSGLATLRAEVGRALRGTGLTGEITGQAAIAVDNQEAFGHGERIVAGATLVLITVLLLLIFRSPVAALLPLLTVGLVYGISRALVALGGQLLHAEVGPELTTLLTVVLFGIGTDYLLFLLFRYRERLRAGDAPREAIITAVARVGQAITSAGFVVIAAFAALVLASLGYFTSLGPALAIAVAVMLLAALTLVPAAVSILGRWVFWPSRTAAPPRRRAFAGLGRLVGRHPVMVIIACLALLAAGAAGLLAFRPSYDPIAQLPADTESTRAFHQLERGFPAGMLNPTDVYLRGQQPLTPAQVAGFVGHLASIQGVVTPGQPVMASDGMTLRVPVVLDAAPYSADALDLVEGPLREQARQAAPPGTQVLIGGQTMTYADVRSATNDDLRLIFPVAAALFVLILAALLRAVLAPAYLVVLVIAGFLATMGAAAWVFGATLAFSIPIVLYLFVTAIGTDYNILVTARLREEMADGRPAREAAGLAVTHAGPSVVAAALILAGTFAALLISGVPFFMQIGFAVTTGILVVSLLVSILLVPAVTGLAGGAAWWPRRGRTGAAGGAVAVPLREAGEAPIGQSTNR